MQVACQPRHSHFLRPPPQGLLAPPWHTRALVALLLAVPLAGLALPTGVVPAASGLASYLPIVLVNTALGAYVARLGLLSSILSSLLGKGWDSPRRALTDSLLAIGLALVVVGLDAALVSAWRAPESVASHALLPRTTAERWLWPLLATSIGVSEELVYRGYLQQQLSRLSASHALGVLLQALLFGIAHAEQGGAVVARFALYGVLFGCTSLARGSLLPSIVAHVGLDAYAGLAA